LTRVCKACDARYGDIFYFFLGFYRYGDIFFFRFLREWTYTYVTSQAMWCRLLAIKPASLQGNNILGSSLR